MTTLGRVLIVDDHVANRKILSRSLGRAGYSIREAVDGANALEIARVWRPDLALLDVGMPRLDGFEVCRQLKASDETEAIPVIFLTALNGAADIERAFAVGGSDYITKPFHLAEVKARVSVHLRVLHAERRLKETHGELLQAQKLEALGQLAAGIAHEINTPTQYVGDNTRFLETAWADLSPLLDRARRMAATARAGDSVVDAAQELEQAYESADYAYLRNEIPVALQQSLDGLQRVSKLVRAMKEFSHPGEQETSTIDVNRAIENTVTVARNEWKYVADVYLDLDPELPTVPGLPSEFNQVLLNIVVNAAHAIGEVTGSEKARRGTVRINRSPVLSNVDTALTPDSMTGLVEAADDPRGRIRIGTRVVGDHVEIRIADTGRGIPKEIRNRIFDPFFTTKEVGRGTGQGLSIARAVVVQKHGGTLTFETDMGHGTVFVIRLPLAQEAIQEDAA